MTHIKRRYINNQEDLEYRIVHGISYEWENALWILDDCTRQAMKKPFFCIKDMKQRLGYWSIEKREICLSRSFVFNHSWDSVCDVLRHEIAHQLAEEVLGAQGESQHGPIFQRACGLLRSNPKASGRYKPLDEMIRGKAHKNDDKIMGRVKKLLALAKSKNQHEAEAAMAKAHEFIFRYNLVLLKQKKNRDFISVFVGRPGLRHFREEYHLAQLLIEYYLVDGLWVSTYVMEKGKMGSVLEITGTLQNIKIACYVYDFINRYVDTSWAEYNKNKGLNRYRKTDYAVGIIEGFSSKLKMQKSEWENSREMYALVKVEDPLLKLHMAYKYPHTTSTRRKISNVDTRVLKDGKKAGDKMVISRGITERSKERKVLIGHSKHL